MPANRLGISLATIVAVPLILVAGATAILLWELNRQSYEAFWVEHTDKVMLMAENARNEFLSMQNTLDAFMISRAPSARDQIDQHWKNCQGLMRQLVAQVIDNPSQEQRLLVLGGLQSQWLEAANSAIAATSESGSHGFAVRATQIGARVQDQFQQVLDAERALRVTRTARLRTAHQVALWGIPIAALILAIGLALTTLREVQLASRTFANALKAAEDANQAKTNFLAVVSHELRNPINSIMLWCNVLQSSGTLQGKAEQGIQAIFRGAKTQAQLIDDLIDVSRIERGQMRLDIQPINLAETVRAAAVNMTPAAEAKGITITVVADPSGVLVLGDSERLQQAVWNLLSNAIKFTPKNGKVELRLERINSHIEITVADNGQGIDKNALANVFDRFWQGENGMRTDRGLGLGLSIVKHIAELHGGSVTAHSDGPGNGSTFVIRLPLPVSKADLTDRRHPTVTPITNDARVPRLDNVAALVVDDDAEARNALRTLLTSLGATVREAPTVEDAIAALAQGAPDVLISDLEMPGRDGYSLVAEIRELERTRGVARHLPIVALTAYGRVEDKVKIFTLGFDSHVIKPVDPAELAAVIMRLVAARQAPLGTASSPQRS
jgi:signal transduction histidine kinase/ActR/RegA family two-component response regulator